MKENFNWPAFLPSFTDAAREAGFIKTILLETSDGPVTAWEKEDNGPTIYLSAGIHGDEPAGPLAALEMLKDGFFQRGFHWRICPALNPGGLALGTRENRAGVDLNRDYLTRSSPEVDAHAAWLLAKSAPDVFISFHEDWESEGFYFYEINLGKDCPERAASLLGAVAEYFPPEIGPEIDGHQSRGPGWIHHLAEPDLPESWPEAIFLAKHGCPLSFTFETPSKHPLRRRVAAHSAAIAALCRQVC